MTPSLEFSLPVAKTDPTPAGDTSPASGRSGVAPREPFDNWMTRALRPDSKEPGMSREPEQYHTSPDQRKTQSPHLAAADPQAPGVATKSPRPVKDTKTESSPSEKSHDKKDKTKTDKHDSTHHSGHDKTGTVAGHLHGALLQAIAAAPSGSSSAPHAPESGKRVESTDKTPAGTDSAKAKGESGKAKLISTAGKTSPKIATLVIPMAAEAELVKKAATGEENKPAGKTATQTSSAKTPDSKSSPVQPDSKSVTNLANSQAKTIKELVSTLAAQKATPAVAATTGPAVTADKQSPITSEIHAMAHVDVPRGVAVPQVHAANQVQLEHGSKASANNAGISAAKLDTTMKNTDKTNKFAQSAEKILPAAAVLSANKNNLPVRGPDAPNPQNNKQPGIIFSTNPAMSDAKSASATPLTAATPASPVVDPGTRALERTHDMIAVQAMRLHDSHSDSLRVVIKPGAGTQLSLELRQHGHSIEAQATLQHGDINQFSQHWPELQQRLEQRGIRMAPLLSQQNAAGNGNQGGFQQHQQPARQDPLAAGAFADFVLAGAANRTSQPAAVPAPAHRGWEGWA